MPLIQQIFGIDAREPPAEPNSLLHAFYVSRSGYGISSLTAIPFNTVVYDRGASLGLSGTFDLVTIPSGVAYGCFGFGTGNNNPGATYHDLQIRINDVEVSKNAWHNSDYNNGFISDWLALSAGDEIKFTFNPNAATTINAFAWGKLYA